MRISVSCLAQNDWLIRRIAAALLKAIAQKLIPGIPEGSRIAILQQTKLTESDEDDKTKDKKGEGSVLQEVIERATARSVIEQEIKGISGNIIPSTLCLHLSD